MYKFRFGLRLKLLLLSSFLFALPWFGYQYVWELEKYLRYGQEQTLIGTARALATALHERPNLFNNQASFLPSVEKGKDLYGYKFNQAIKLDGLYQDWPSFIEQAHYYGSDHQLNNPLPIDELSLHYTAAVGKYDKYLYLFFNVVDQQTIYRGKNSRSITKNDHLELGFVNADGDFNRYIISNKQPGWIDAYKITDTENDIPISAPMLQGQWLATPHGYHVEIRVPLANLGDKIAFAIHDVDVELGDVITSIGSADPSSVDTLGTVLVPSPEIERIVKGMSYTNSSILVVDHHRRVLATAGDIKKASGVWRANVPSKQTSNFWYDIEQNWLLPLYYQVLTKPSKDFIDQLYDASNLTGEHIEQALIGQASSNWRLTQDQQAVILSAAYPIYIDNEVKGVVIVEETTNGIRTLRNRALEKLFTSILSIMLIGALAFLIFSSRISSRIRRLRNQAEQSIDKHGRINNLLVPSTTNDEIGDLSRSFATAVNRLSQYNHYLENMSSRLSHELRTPIAVVRTSLENLTMQPISEQAAPYIERAQSGVNRLNLILTNMSEATRIEQMLHTTDKHEFDANQVINGCILGYQQIYPSIHFNVSLLSTTTKICGSAEHFAQLLDKVIANAVEFTNDNIVNIAVTTQASSLILHIANNGVLLPVQMQSQLFDSMVSVRENNSQGQPHLGLGLYIARLICEFHKGRISAMNQEKAPGVIITITIPLAN
ncbi:proteobacterial dedicated sortase system histidine kinase [Colwelliaceae bacterium 6471]